MQTEQEQVLFDDPQTNITVTDTRYIVGDAVIGIDSLSHAAWANSDGFKDYATAVLFAIGGLALVLTFSWWSILGLVLLLNPLLVVFQKKKYWLLVFSRSGGALSERGDPAPMYTKEMAQGIADALNTAIRQYRAANDPRANLNL